MKSLITAVLVILCATSVWAQKINFLNEDFNNIATWKQDGDKFINSDDASFITDTSSSTGTDIVCHSIDNLFTERLTTHWLTTVRCGYDNNSVNNFQIYLMANGSNPNNGNFEGYAIGTGFAPNYKGLSLVHNYGGAIEVLYNEDSNFPKNKNTSIAVSRTPEGTWSLNGNTIYQEPQFRFHESNTIVVSYSFSKTGAQQLQFSFSDIHQEGTATTHNSTIDSAKIIDAHTIRIFHNARLNDASASSTSHYSINGNNPAYANHQFTHTDIIFSSPIPSGTQSTLTIQGIRDADGNTVNPFQQDITQAGYGWIVFNEIMVDLNPLPYALPVAKYLELFNASDTDIDLTGYKLVTGDHENTIPQSTIGKGGYLIICQQPGLFQQYGQCVAALQDSKLPISGKHLALVNHSGEIVDSLTYSDKMYNDSQKKDGGYSMERRDPFNNCQKLQNWHASTDLSGGTPGRQNSQYELFEGKSRPQLTRYSIVSTNQISLEFSETMTTAELMLNGQKPSCFFFEDNVINLHFVNRIAKGDNRISGHAGNECGIQTENIGIEFQHTPLTAESLTVMSRNQVMISFSTQAPKPQPSNFVLDGKWNPNLCEMSARKPNEILLTFGQNLELDKPHQIHISSLGNSIGETVDTTFSFETKSEDFKTAAYGQIVINEIMFDLSPSPYALPKAKYVELLNTSQSDFKMGGYKFMVGENEYNIPNVNLKAGGFMIIASSDTTFARYGTCVKAMQESRLTMSGKFLKIINPDGAIVDSLTYSQKLYNDPTRSNGGFSIERMDPVNGCNGNLNWKACTDMAGGTPGRQNSNFQPFVDDTEPMLESYSMQSTSGLRLSFSEKIKECRFEINGQSPKGFSIEGNTIDLTLSNPIKDGINIVTGTVHDQCGTASQQIEIELPYTPFRIEEAHAVSQYQVAVAFSTEPQKVDVENFRLNDAEMPILCEYISDDRRKVLLSFADNFESNRRYKLDISNIKSNINEEIESETLKFRYHSLQPGDIIINEVMFYPKTKAKRYLELYNNSDNGINLYGLKIRHLSADLATIKECLIDGYRMLNPGEYVAITADTATVRETHLLDNCLHLMQCPKFPALNTAKGYISVSTPEDLVLDSMYYDKNMHSKILEDPRGVALERICKETTLQSPKENWHSASPEHGYGSPGMENSQRCQCGDDEQYQPSDSLTEAASSNADIEIENQLLHAGDGGRPLIVTFNIMRNDVCLSMIIHDPEGRQVTTVAASVMAYPGMSLSWNGTDKSGNRCQPGIYVIIIKAIDSTGWSHIYKRACVVGAGS